MVHISQALDIDPLNLYIYNLLEQISAVYPEYNSQYIRKLYNPLRLLEKAVDELDAEEKNASFYAVSRLVKGKGKAEGRDEPSSSTSSHSSKPMTPGPKSYQLYHPLNFY